MTLITTWRLTSGPRSLEFPLPLASLQRFVIVNRPNYHTIERVDINLTTAFNSAGARPTIMIRRDVVRVSEFLWNSMLELQRTPQF